MGVRMSIEDLFEKPEIPVEVRVPDDVMRTFESRNVAVSRAIKIGLFALLSGHDEGMITFDDHVSGREPIKSGRRLTIRVPVGVHEEVSRITQVPIQAVLQSIAMMFHEFPETIEHV